MDKTAEKFVSYACDLTYADLTPKAIHEATRCVVDSIGCAFGAFDEEPVKALRNMASRISSTEPATVIGTKVRSTPELAGFVNGTAIRYRDFSDDYFGASGKQGGPHPSDNIGSILAATESVRGGGKALILGIALAYEACDQLVEHAILHSARGWDYPIMHSISTSLGAGKVLGLTKEQLRNALGLAIVANICIRQTRRGELSNWKGMAGPNGSRNGMFAALMAKEGITGPTEAFEGSAGFMKQLGAPFELGDLGGGGVPFKIESTYFKYLPVMYSLQPPIWAAIALRTQVKIEDIESIVVYADAHVSENDAFTAGRWIPKTRESADHSGPYLIAAALVDGEITAQTMTPQRFLDPAILAVTKKILVEEDKEYTAAYPRLVNCRLEATLKSGKVITVHQTYPKGHPLNPMSDQDLEQKFIKQVETLLPSNQSRSLLDNLWDLEKVDDVAALFPLMVVQRK